MERNWGLVEGGDEGQSIILLFILGKLTITPLWIGEGNKNG
jgi:hypothetical protein